MNVPKVRFESSDDFHEIFSRIYDNDLEELNVNSILKAIRIDTELGPMVAIADDHELYLLEFITRRGLEKELQRLKARNFKIIPGITPPLQSIRTELTHYFSGQLTQFKTPYRVFGSPFQQTVWQALCNIGYGETKSYLEQATTLKRPTACRAVANANGANQLAIIIPCHRIIASDGSLGGYGGGIEIKRWLLNHEKHHKSSLIA